MSAADGSAAEYKPWRPHCRCTGPGAWPRRISGTAAAAAATAATAAGYSQDIDRSKTGATLSTEPVPIRPTVQYDRLNKESS